MNYEVFTHLTKFIDDILTGLLFSVYSSLAYVVYQDYTFVYDFDARSLINGNSKVDFSLYWRNEVVNQIYDKLVLELCQKSTTFFFFRLIRIFILNQSVHLTVCSCSYGTGIHKALKGERCCTVHTNFTRYVVECSKQIIILKEIFWMFIAKASTFPSQNTLNNSEGVILPLIISKRIEQNLYSPSLYIHMFLFYKSSLTLKIFNDKMHHPCNMRSILYHLPFFCIPFHIKENVSL